MTPQEAIKFIKEHGFATVQSRVEFQLAIGVLEEYFKEKPVSDKPKKEKLNDK